LRSRQFKDLEEQHKTTGVVGAWGGNSECNTTTTHAEVTLHLTVLLHLSIVRTTSRFV